MKCIVVDDEPIALDGIASYVEKTPFLELIGKCRDAYEALKLISEKDVDLVFLDINMPELSGLEMVNALENPPMIIFTTAYSDYALKGFELNAVDYILKPISYSKFLKASQKAHNLHNHSKAENNQEDELIYIKVNKKLVRIKLADILFIESLKDYIQIHTVRGKFVTYLSLNKIVESLSSHLFIQVHKSYIVAFDSIETIEGNRIKIGKQIIPIGRSFKGELDKRISNKVLKK